MDQIRTHKTTHWLGAGAILAVSLLLSLGCSHDGVDGATPTSAREQLASPVAIGNLAGIAAKKLGVNASDVTVSAGQTLSLPLTGKGPITRHKAHTVLAGQPAITGVAVDSNGNEVDADSLIAAEQAAWRAKHGKKTVDMYNKVQSATSGQMLRVSVWLRIPDADLATVAIPPAGDGVPKSAQLGKEAAESQRAAAISAYAKSTANVKSRFLAKLSKIDPNATDLGSEPYFVASLPVEMVTVLESDPDVDSIDIADRVPQAQLDNAHTILQYGRVHAAPTYITGSGVKLGQVEPSAPLPSST